MTARLNSSLAVAFLLAALCILPACGGGSASPTPPPPPPPAQIEVLYVTNASQVTAFPVNTSTGALGTPTSVAGPSTSFGIVVNPGGKFLYVSDAINDTVSTYSIDATSGALTAVGTPAAIGTAPGGGVQSGAGLAMDPAGKFLYAADFFAARTAAFTASGSSGALAAVGGSPYPTSVSGGVIGSAPTQLVTDPAGKFLYVSDQGDPLGGVSSYTINSTTGGLSLVPGAPFTSLVSGGPYGLAVHPNGKFLYVADRNVSRIVGNTINSDGTLTTLVGLPFTTGANPIGMALDPSGKHLYTANSGDGTISAFNVDANSGALTAIGSAVAVGAAPYSLAVDPTGKFLYVTNPQGGAAGTITGFSIDSTTGALTKFSGQPFAAGNGPVSLTVAVVP